MSEETQQSIDTGEHVYENAVLVSNIQNLSEEQLTIYFQSESKSGGGEVAVNGFRRLHDDCAVVIFRGNCIQQRILGRDHELFGYRLKVEPCPKLQRSALEAQLTYNLWGKPLVGGRPFNQQQLGGNSWSKPPPQIPVTSTDLLGVHHMVGSSDMSHNAPIFGTALSSCSNVHSKAKDFALQTSLAHASTGQVKQAAAPFHGCVLPPPGFQELLPTHIPRLLEVSGFGEVVTKEMIELYFENKKKSGGGDIKDIQFDSEKKKATVEFNDPTVVDSVLSRADHTIMGQKLKVMLYVPKPRTAVRVTGMSKDTSLETLELYFENPKKSHGGDIVNKWMNDERTVAVIDYGSVKVAERVAEKVEHIFLKASLTVVQCSPDEEIDVEQMSSEGDGPLCEESVAISEAPPMTAVRIVNFDPKTPDEILELFFENQKKCGGSDILSLRVNDERTVAVVDYGSEEVARNVADYPELVLDETVLTAELCSPDDPMENSSSDIEFVLEVSGFKQSTSEANIKQFFENKKRSGGGPLASMEPVEDRSTRTYRLSFQNTYDAQCVLKKKVLKLESVNLDVVVSGTKPKQEKTHSTSRHTIEQEEEIPPPIKTIRVSKLPEKTSRDLLENYFENRRKSGGGKVEKIELEEIKGTALVTFAEASAADRVWQKRLHHKLNNSPIDVELVQPPKPKKKLPLDPHILAICNIPASATYDSLVNYLESKTRCDVKEILYGETPGSVFVIFNQKPDIDQLKETCKRKSLEKSFLHVEQVHLTDSIQVHDLPPNCTEDALENYFENVKKSGGGDVENVVIHRNGKVAVTTFVEYGVLPNVLKIKKHEINNHEVKVSEYHEKLGFRHPEEDASQPAVRVPEHVLVGPLNKAVVEFISTRMDSRQLFESELQRHHGKLKWESCTVDSFLVTCELSSPVQIMELPHPWEEMIKTAVNNFLDKYCSEHINVLQDIWDDLVKTLPDSMKGYEKEAVLEKSDRQHIIRIIGLKRAVEALATKVNKEKQNLEDEFDRKSREVTETVTKLEDYELRFLHEIGVDLFGCKCKIDLTNAVIQFTGIPLEVNKAKTMMYEILRNLDSETIGSTPAICHLLQNPECQDYIYSQFHSQKLTVALSKTNNDITVRSSNKTSARKAAQIVSQELKEVKIPIEKESTAVLKSSSWQKIKADQLERYKGCLEIIECSDFSQLVVAGTSHVIANVCEVVQDFIDQNTIYKDNFALSRGHFRFIVEYKRNKIHEFQESLKKHFVAIEMENELLVIRGTKLGLGFAKKKLQELLSTIRSRGHDVTEPGMAEFFSQGRGKTFLESVQGNNNCIIEVVNDQSTRDEVEPGFVMLDENDNRAALQVSKNGKIFKVIQGDLTKHKVDVIVNAANGELRNIGGLAGAILKEGGKSIQDECDKWVEQHGKLLPGGAAILGSGKLPCRNVVHVVGPLWSGGYSNEENYLFEGISRALEVTEKKRLASLAIPAVGAGVFRVPLKLSTQTVVRAVVDYFASNPQSCIKEVHFVDPQDGNVQEFCNAVTTEIGLSDMPSSSLRTKVVPDLPEEFSSNSSEVASTLKKTASNELTTRSGVVIKMKKGQLADEKAAVLVNTVGTELNLSHGAVSNSLLKNAGAQLQQECSRLHPNGIKYGEVLDTKGFNLKCQKVYYLAAMQFGTPQTERILRQTIRECLKKADRESLGSIAFPAIGTGNLGYPRDFVARVMFEEFGKFSEMSPLHLKDIRIVVYDKDVPTCQAFEAEISRLTNHPKTSKRHDRAKRRNQQIDVIEEPSGAGTPSKPEISMDKDCAKIGHLLVRVLQGDITKQMTDAIVNPTNNDLDLTVGEVSRAIAKAGGSAIAKECKRLKGMLTDGCAVTNAGRLPCKHILHVDIQSTSTSEAVKKALRTANSCGFTSLSMPAVGTATSPDKIEEQAQNLFGAIGKKASELNVLLSINIVIYQSQMVKVYKEAMHSVFRNQGQKSLGRRFLDYISGRSDEEEAKYSVPSASDLHFQFYAENDQDIDSAISRIKECCREEATDEVMDANQKEDYDVIRILTDTEVKAIESLEHRHFVKIEVEKSARVNRIRIRGRTDNVFKVKNEVVNILHSAKQRAMLEDQAEVLGSHVQWVRQDEDSWEPYSKVVNLAIEQAFLKEEKFVCFEDEDVKCTIDFDKMEEREVDDNTSVSKVKRVTTGGSDEIPSSWDPMTSNLLLVDLPPTSAEFLKVSGEFTQTQPSTIIKIQRIQNKRLWKTYVNHKQHMDSTNPQGTQNERVLYHGTSADTVDKINDRGFNRSFCGKNAIVYGSGVYFAVHANYSARNPYAQPDASGQRHVYQCKVLTGEFTVGNSSMKEPPAKNGTDLYDSTCDNPASPGIFVVFHDNAAYPEYLIVFM